MQANGGIHPVDQKYMLSWLAIRHLLGSCFFQIKQDKTNVYILKQTTITETCSCHKNMSALISFTQSCECMNYYILDLSEYSTIANKGFGNMYNTHTKQVKL
jgi:hypothetical protein